MNTNEQSHGEQSHEVSGINFSAEDFSADNFSADNFSGTRVALCVTGGIAAYKAIEVLRELQKRGCLVRVAMSQRACEFVRPLTFRALSNAHVLVDDYAADNPDPIAHITFSQSVDLIIVAPATANTIAKFANGIADDFITSTYLAANAPVVVAPAMNTTMWLHPATQRNLETLARDGLKIVEPDEGIMACGTTGAGRLSQPETIVRSALQFLSEHRRTKELTNSRVSKDALHIKHDSHLDLEGEKVLITAGATREEIDPVRFISNRSSGKMGFALAAAAHARGARAVTVIAGVTNVEPPANVRVINAISSDEMHRAVMREIDAHTIFIAAAAVADYKPVTRANEKIKKSDSKNLTLELEPTIDILAAVATHRKQKSSTSTPLNLPLLVIGFAAETTNIEQHALAKLKRKNLDAIVANDVTRSGAGFDTDTNIITIYTRENSGQPIALEKLSKLAAAHRILDETQKLRAKSASSVAASSLESI